MATAYREKAFLAKAERSLEIGSSHPEISNSLSEFTYDSAKMDEGKALHKETLTIWFQNSVEQLEKSSAHDEFEIAYKTLQTAYNRDRRRAKAVFRKDPASKARLLIDGIIAESFDNFMTMAERFYKELSSSSELLNKLAPMKITPETITVATALFSEVKRTRIAYLEERAEALEYTNQKNKSLNLLDEWMNDFYTVAKIALEDKKQLLDVFEN